MPSEASTQNQERFWTLGKIWLLKHPWGYLVGGYKGWATGHDDLLQEDHTLLVLGRKQLRYFSLMLYIVIIVSFATNINTFAIKGDINYIL